MFITYFHEKKHELQLIIEGSDDVRSNEISF